ncbi:hypothetical protein CRENBAI_014246, partial [Crenichthys baileyi]
AARAWCQGLTGAAYSNQLWSISRLGCQHSSAQVFAIVVACIFHLLDPVSDHIKNPELKLPRTYEESSSSWQPKLLTPKPQASEACSPSTKPQSSP